MLDRLSLRRFETQVLVFHNICSDYDNEYKKMVESQILPEIVNIILLRIYISYLMAFFINLVTTPAKLPTFTFNKF